MEAQEYALFYQARKQNKEPTPTKGGISETPRSRNHRWINFRGREVETPEPSPVKPSELTAPRCATFDNAVKPRSSTLRDGRF